MDDLISRQAAIDAIKRCESAYSYDLNNGLILAMNAVADAPTIEERKKGEWRTILYHITDDGDELYEHYCSECKKTVMISNLKKGRFNYCPNCGADMRGGSGG